MEQILGQNGRSAIEIAPSRRAKWGAVVAALADGRPRLGLRR
jgi:hypothetical protein